MWNQKTGRVRQSEPVVWDYHVVTLYRHQANEPWLIEDQSSQLPLPCQADMWLQCSFAYSAHLPEQFHPRFRWIGGKDYLEEFCSNRRHMLDDCGKFSKPPPPWPPIGASRGSMIDRYSDDGQDCAGRLFDLPTLLDELRKK